MKKINFFCTSHKSVDYLEKLSPKIHMIELGNQSFPKTWIDIKNKINISHKFFSYGDLIAHYYVWKNLLHKYSENHWIGFFQYRRFWLKYKIRKAYPLGSLDSLMLTEPDTSWKDYDTIMPSPFIFKKKIKELFKNVFLFKFLKDFDLIKYHTKIQKQFEDSLGPAGRAIIIDLIKILPYSEKIGFHDFLNERNYLSAHGMYISKKIIINSYSEILFSWFLKCENIINKDNNLSLLNNQRIFQYINERFLDYWMSKNVRVNRWPIAMYNKEKAIITPIGKI
jgi:hypothetical protein